MIYRRQKISSVVVVGALSLILAGCGGIGDEVDWGFSELSHDGGTAIAGYDSVTGKPVFSNDSSNRKYRGHDVEVEHGHSSNGRRHDKHGEHEHHSDGREDDDDHEHEHDGDHSYGGNDSGNKKNRDRNDDRKYGHHSNGRKHDKHGKHGHHSDGREDDGDHSYGSNDCDYRDGGGYGYGGSYGYGSNDRRYKDDGHHRYGSDGWEHYDESEDLFSYGIDDGTGYYRDGANGRDHDYIRNLSKSNQEYVYVEYKGGDNGRVYMYETKYKGKKVYRKHGHVDYEYDRGGKVYTYYTEHKYHNNDYTERKHYRHDRHYHGHGDRKHWHNKNHKGKGHTGGRRGGNTVACPDATTSEVLYVDKDNATPGDGSSWSKAYNDLSKALAEAHRLNTTTSTKVTQVWIAAGTYIPSLAGFVAESDVQKRYFTLLDDVKIYGGFAGTESDVAARDTSVHKVILSGDINGDDQLVVSGSMLNNTENVYHVVKLDNISDTAELHGVTISGGNAVGSSGDGGGVYVTGGSPIFSNVIITKNTAGRSGGGIYASKSNLTLTNVMIDYNFAFGAGGIYIKDAQPTLNAVRLYKNSANKHGGGIFAINSNIVFVDSIIYANQTTSDNGNGGGVYASNSTLAFDNVLIKYNQTAGSYSNGGGVYASNSSVTFNKSSVSGNKTMGYASNGGGSYITKSGATFINTTINGNRITGAVSNGGGVYSSAGNNLDFINVTLANNTALSEGGGLYVKGNAKATNLINTIVWGNREENNVYTDQSAGAAIKIDPLYPTTVKIAYSIIQFAKLSGSNVITKGIGNAVLGDNSGNNLFDDPKLIHISSYESYAEQGLENNGSTTPTIIIDANSPAASAGVSVSRCNYTPLKSAEISTYCLEDNSIIGGWKVMGSTDIAGIQTGAVLNTTDARGYTIPSGKVAIGAYNPDAIAP